MIFTVCNYHHCFTTIYNMNHCFYNGSWLFKYFKISVYIDIWYSNPSFHNISTVSIYNSQMGVVLVADPSAAEEASMDGSLTFSINAHQ